MLGAAIAGVGIAAGGLGTYASMSAGSQLFGRTLIAGNDPQQVALTFDDGPNGDTTLRLLDVLAKHGARATFFVIGKFVRQQPEVVRAVRVAGHIVGNHTMTHPWLHIQSHARIREELSGCNKAIEDVLGEPVRYFRAPHGARRPYVLRYAAELGFVPVQWNVIVGDWNPHPATVLEERVNAGIRRAQGKGKSTNVVLHDGWDQVLGGADRMPSVEAVESLLAGFAARGIQAVGIDAWESPEADQNVVGVPATDEQMQKAIRQATASLSQFFDAYRDRKENQKGFCLKVRFEYEGKVEHIWLSDLDFGTTPPSGVVGNVPRIPSVKYMERVTFSAAQVTDWMYIEDDQLIGAYTTKLLKSTLRISSHSKILKHLWHPHPNLRRPPP